MTFSRILFWCLVLVLAGCRKEAAETAKSTAVKADTVYTNGKIYTVNEAQPWAEAVAIKDRKFIAVGSNADVTPLIGEKTEAVDLRGQFVMPGIVDMHAHPFSGVEMGTGGINLTEPGNPDAILATVKEYLAAHPDKPFVMGGNWNIGGVFKNDSPDKKLLDAIAPNTPIFLLSQSGHSAWVNSKALEVAGIDENFKNEGAYVLDRYPGTNEPSGTVRESAMVLIVSAMGYMSPEEFKPFLGPELGRYSRYGITAIQAAEGSKTWLRAAAELEKEGKLNVRLFPALDWLTSQLRALRDEESLAFINDWKSYQTDLIRPHYVKIFADGAADTHTLLMKQPYADSPGNRGSMYLPLDKYREAILDFHSKGISVHVHAMGDATSANIIGIFEEAEKKFPNSQGVLHLGHSTSVDDEDLDRLAALKKATMNFSPMLAVGHPQMDLFLKTPLGEKRHQQMFPVKAAMEKGLTVGFGSDFPSSLVPNPDAFFLTHGLRRWFISTCRNASARTEVVELMTHNARGEVIDAYTSWEWSTLCGEITKPKVDLQPVNLVILPLEKVDTCETTPVSDQVVASDFATRDQSEMISDVYRWRRWESKTAQFVPIQATTGNHRKPDPELPESKDEKKHVRENALPSGKIGTETAQGRADVGETPTAETLGMLARKVLSSSRHTDSRRLAHAVLRILALNGA